MPQPFFELTLEEFADLLERFRFDRKIDAVHMHHTWRPAHRDWRGAPTVEAMWRFHTKQNGWSDIAQHVTIAPDGKIWTGRDWNVPPASAVGYNGNAAAGPFMFETVGDFDRGCDPLEGAQREAVIGVIARVQERFDLPLESLRFHNSMTNQKTCPGTSVARDDILREVQQARAALSGGARGSEGWAKAEHLKVRGHTEDVLRAWDGRGARAMDPLDAEPRENDLTPQQQRLISGIDGTTLPAPASRGGAVARGPALTPEMLAELRPHVIDLNQGRFSGDGLYRTAPADVDAIFDEYLERARERARGRNRPLRVLFWAHGGLIDEASGLWIAHQQVAWWNRNDVYPIHFVWETGFLDALKQILAGVRAAPPTGARDVWDHTTDLAVEAVARALGGEKIWSAMKRSAELASERDGGAAYVAARLNKFCQAHPGEVELHAVGHSAGSIFHAHFLPAAFELGVPPFKTFQLLAPAIRVDTFKRRILPRVESSIGQLTMFTMKQDWEQSDNVVGVYRKSLLWLINRALEAETGTPVLGLEVAVRADDQLRQLFGLRGTPSPRAELVWSVSEATTGTSASTSRSHGGFDNDRPTMNSVLRRIVGADPIVDFPEEAVERGLGRWQATHGIPPELAWLFDRIDTPPAWTSAPAVAPPVAPVPSASGGRRALCVGIDRYPTMPLAGCVADARQWASTLGALGFQTSLLLDQTATRQAMLDAVTDLVTRSQAGDVVIFQYSGHGTEVDDLDGDEIDGNNGARDEALCPYDIADGAFLIDDDLAAIFGRIPDGVNVTCFIDCCHSGTVTRFMVGANRTAAGAVDRRARFIIATPEMEAAHRRFRERLGRSRAPRGTPDQMRQVVFSACRDNELAYETAGHGEFTTRATALLANGIDGITHEEFQRRVTQAFGPAPQQHPELDCATSARAAALLQPRAPSRR